MAVVVVLTTVCTFDVDGATVSGREDSTAPPPKTTSLDTVRVFLFAHNSKDVKEYTRERAATRRVVVSIVVRWGCVEGENTNIFDFGHYRAGRNFSEKKKKKKKKRFQVGKKKTCLPLLNIVTSSAC